MYTLTKEQFFPNKETFDGHVFYRIENDKFLVIQVAPDKNTRSKLTELTSVAKLFIEI